MDYTQEYKQKLVSADEAVKVIKSGDWVKIRLNHNTRDVYMAKPPWIHSRRVTLFYI